MKCVISGMWGVIGYMTNLSTAYRIAGVAAALSVIAIANQLPAQRQEPLLANDNVRRNVPIESEVLEQKGLSRDIMISFRNVRLADALEVIAKQAGFRIGFSNEVSQSAKRVTIENKRMTASQAILAVLEGTGLEYRVSGTDQVYVTSSAPLRKTQDYGVIMGQVLDSATGVGIAKASVLIPGSKVATVTDDLGKFSLQKVPVGEVTVSIKALGYLSMTQRVEVDNTKPVVLRLLLRAMATQLSGVITTVTGVQRKVEIGNDITSIQVDEVIRNNPVSNMSELLATRVPGLYAAPMSGQPGAPTRLRIRGVSSINASNEPIIVIDGVRIRSQSEFVDNNPTGTPGGVGFEFSPLDQLDVNAIEKVEVLKGPSAVALYGSDAANGVIVITSKRGKPGPTRWNASTRFGLEYMPGRWPDNYYTWGTNKLFGGASLACFHNQWASSQGCAPDSMIVYQLLNDPHTTVLGRGNIQEYSVGVNGGARDITYSLTASAQRTLGLMKMSNVDLQTLREANLAVPFWQRRPQSANKTVGSAIVRMEPGRATSVELTSSISTSNARSTPLSDAMQRAAEMAPPNSASINGFGEWGSVITVIRNFREKQTINETGYRNALRLQNRTLEAMNATLSVGLDNRILSRREFLGHGQLYLGSMPGMNDSGRIYEKHTSATTVDVHSNISMSPLGHRMLNLIPSAGLNFNRNAASTFSGTTTRGLIPGATGLSGAPDVGVIANADTRNTAGVYTEVRVNVADRFWLPLSFRSDAGSALGRNVISGFPKLSFSYLLSEQPAFREVPIVGALPLFRVRAAWGKAGKQPETTARYRTYQVTAGENEFQLNSLGNAGLRPERSQEVELGFDSDIIDDGSQRLTLAMTWARKKTSDLLVADDVPLSIGVYRQWTNLGDVLNSTFEASIDGLLQHSKFAWQPSLNISTLRNRLLSVGRRNDARPGGNTGWSSSLPNAGLANRHVVGYPLYGRWAREIVGYADRNGDGIIEQDEVA